MRGCIDTCPRGTAAPSSVHLFHWNIRSLDMSRRAYRIHYHHIPCLHNWPHMFHKYCRCIMLYLDIRMRIQKGSTEMRHMGGSFGSRSSPSPCFDRTKWLLLQWFRPSGLHRGRYTIRLLQGYSHNISPCVGQCSVLSRKLSCLRWYPSIRQLRDEHISHCPHS